MFAKQRAQVRYLDYNVNILSIFFELFSGPRASRTNWNLHVPDLQGALTSRYNFTKNIC